MYFKIMTHDFKTPENLSDREYSQILDHKYGLKIDEIENELCKNAQKMDKAYSLGTSRTWVGLHPQIFQTPYSEIDEFLSILSRFNPKSIIDLGAAYGRVALVMQKHMPECQFKGFEFVKERCDEGNRIFKQRGLSNCSLIAQNIVKEKFKLPIADIYFIYDFSDQHDQKKVLDIFSKKMEIDKFFLIVRGKSMRSLIQNKYQEFHNCFKPLHQENWSIYSTWCDFSG